ncbi:Equilibrative nucleoside transporter 3 [Frankliniella fusca]|uniref:Equilibrative nucleoside transporter 3 n=1 Tax=Frankliniella fusca TaxID=407009 RepID=A0AAE1H5Z7_9NEOP|nr:Equilibrative nucleoside transporter 3 [Frankliniella fusca]
MDDHINTQPLLQCETESDFDDDDDLGISPPQHSVDDPTVVTKDTKPLFKQRDPQDRYSIAYIIFYFLGMTTLIPWNFFITADDYWMYKFRDVNASHPASVFGNSSEGMSRTPLQKSFTAYLSVASTVPSTLFLIANSALSHRISIHSRMLGSFVAILGLFVITTVFVHVDTDACEKFSANNLHDQEQFFYVTMAIVVALNSAGAVLTGGLFGMLGKFSPAYISAASSGQSLGGIFAAVAEIVSLWLGASPQLSAFVYFMVANVFLVLSIVFYLVLIRAVFFKYHMEPQPQLSVQFEPGCAPSVEEHVNSLSYKRVLSKVWVYGIAVWMCFFVSLSFYPALTVLVESQNKGHGNAWNDKYFVPVVAYLIYSLFEFLGRVLAGRLLLPHQNAPALLLMSAARVIFVPLLLYCNAQPRQHLPVLIHEDAIYILIVVLFGFTNGYLVNITMISAPKACEYHEQEMAASIMSAFLGVGLSCGALLSMAIVSLI